MISRKYVAVLAATTFLTAGAAFASNQMPPDQQKVSAQQKTVDTDYGKLSADGSKAYHDVTLARLAIFDGRIDDAKKYVNQADDGFGKAQNDETIFTKAEADLKPGMMNAKAAAAPAAGTGSPSDKQADQAKPAIAWLPVDGTISINEDYSMNPAKTAAVSDADKSLKAGDRDAAMSKLKLADVDVGVTLAVVPLQKTLTDVHQAVGMMNDGKYYEASQLLRQAQDGERFDVASIYDVPKTSAVAAKPTAGAATTASKAAPAKP